MDKHWLKIENQFISKIFTSKVKEFKLAEAAGKYPGDGGRDESFYLKKQPGQYY